ncbi:DUF4296 domain-containing protein [Hyunsoonleella pacifica]|uniref:DUF4296 domain-containing protein n=1 Tax=Hyunsoonleella pacifica TaxID=1080224 RepID=A0A4Q9FR24_9FLAO|nr:DUF4296 domain-containing protein [Hyunsoonleella pacifica]TBN15696.1 DUF4296 domain-containing protein [Hyunsoonleella pacifica]GGD21885.1 hypothetical protein GCM10011368_24920 [Hyunsoonleella pacifica]
MYKKTIILLCMVLGLTSCYRYNKPDKPKNLIPKDKMVHVLLDLKYLGAITGKDKKVLDSAKVNPEGYVYKKYNVDSTQFAESNAYYTYFMDEYAEIYKKVKDSLTKLKAHYKKILDKERQEKKKADSLKAIKQELEAIELDTEVDLKELELIAPVSDTDSLSPKSHRQ